MPSATPPSFGLFADLHYAQGIRGNRHYSDSLVKLDACLARFHDLGTDLVFSLGDNVDSGASADDDQRFLEGVLGRLGSFRGKLYWVLGNHDLAAHSKRAFLGAVGARQQSPFHSFDHGGVHFAILDTNCHEDGSDFDAGNFSWERAWMAPSQIAWLAADLAAAGGAPAVVLCHGNLDPHEWNGGPDPHCVRNADLVRAVLEQAGNVRGVFQGHYHPGRTMVLNGIPYVTLAAMVTGPASEGFVGAVATLPAEGGLVVKGLGNQPDFVHTQSGGEAA